MTDRCASPSLYETLVSKMKLDRPASAILFDLGNTLWPDIWSASDERLATLANRRVDEFLVSRGLEIPGAPAGVGERIRSAVLAAYQLAGSTDRRSPRLDLVCRDVVRELGLALNLAQCNAVLDCINLEGPESGRILFEDALPVLETLQARGFKMGIVSNRLFADERLA